MRRSRVLSVGTAEGSKQETEDFRRGGRREDDSETRIGSKAGGTKGIDETILRDEMEAHKIIVLGNYSSTGSSIYTRKRSVEQVRHIGKHKQ